MGAFAWVDRTADRLVLACDAGSEKPLYYYSDGHQFAFASEVKTLLTLLGRKFALDRDTVGQFIFQGLSDTSTRTFFRGISRLDAGTYLELALAGDSRGIESVRYEPPPYPDDPASMSLEEFTGELRRIFIDSVRVRLRSDVPVGVLLSGGIDSSSIAGTAQMLIGRESAPRLLSAISDDRRFDETTHIDVMERHLKQTAHRITLRTAPETLLADLSTVNWYNDAPVAGLSALGHYRLMERAKELGLTVILSGQGADEILLGYRKFLGFYLQSLLRHGRYLKAAGVLGQFAINRTVVNQFDASDAKRDVPVLRMVSRALNGDESDSATEGARLKGWKPLWLGLGIGITRRPTAA